VSYFTAKEKVKPTEIDKFELELLPVSALSLISDSHSSEPAPALRRGEWISRSASVYPPAIRQDSRSARVGSRASRWRETALMSRVILGSTGVSGEGGSPRSPAEERPETRLR
jgi:hypothetical protein